MLPVSHTPDGYTNRGTQETRGVHEARGIDYYRDAQARIAPTPVVQLHLGVTVGGVEAVPGADHPREARIRVHTTAGVIAARHVVDTRPVDTPATLFQCFVGAEVDHGGSLHRLGDGSDARIDPGTAGLMTRMRTDGDGFVFTYVLPFTPTTALVELTRFSSTPLPLERVARERDDELAALGLARARVVREEAGILPMGADPAPRPGVPGVVRAGNGGGALRAATGYAFARIQQWADACADAMIAGRAPIAHPAEPWVRREMDRIFLQTLRAHPDRAPEFFLALAERVEPARLVRFLTDRASASDLAAIILALPFGTFLAQLPDRTATIERAWLGGRSGPRESTIRELVS